MPLNLPDALTDDYHSGSGAPLGAPPRRDPPPSRLISALVLLLGFALFLGLPFVLSVGSVVFLPPVTAMIFTIILSPFADRLIRLGLPNLLASFLAIAAMLAAIVLSLTLILQPAFDMVDQVPAMARNITQRFTELRGSFEWISDVNRQIARLIGHTSRREVVLAEPSVLEQVAFATPSLVLETLLTLLMAFFMIEARTRMKRRLLLDRQSFGASLRVARVLRDVQDRVASYILTVAMINLGVGLLVAFGAWQFGFTAPVMWGGLAFVLNFLPYVGPLAMMGLLALVGVGTADTVLLGLVPMLAFLGLQTGLFAAFWAVVALGISTFVPAFGRSGAEEVPPPTIIVVAKPTGVLITKLFDEVI